jgi:LysR family glycine cleavage system transcriptional activator
MSRIPNLSALRAFEATVRHGSVRRAAHELHLTDGAVSRALREMEADLGFALFERRNRRIMPTATARALADEVRLALDHLAGALGRARESERPNRSIVLSCEPTFLIRWLIPRLASLQEAVGPDRDLRLVSAGGAVPFAREGIDLAVRRADFPIGADIRAESFLDERVGPVCRPEMASSVGVSGLLTGSLLHSATRPGAWHHWAALTDCILQASREITFEHFYLSLQAAVAGAGVAIGPVALVADDLASGVLVAPRGFVADGSTYVLMAPRASHDAALFRAVLGWLMVTSQELP